MALGDLRFLASLYCIAVPHCCTALLYRRYDVEAVSAQVDDFVRDLSVCLDAFRTCGQLQDLLAFVRSIANTMNASSAAGQAEGLKLESLARLQVGGSAAGVLSVCVAGCGWVGGWGGLGGYLWVDGGGVADYVGGCGVSGCVAVCCCCCCCVRRRVCRALQTSTCCTSSSPS